MKKIIKIILIFTIVFLTLGQYKTVYAANGVEALDEEDPDYYSLYIRGMRSEDVNVRVRIILGAIRAIGVLSSIIALMIMGIKYMLGSLEEKAEFKKKLPIYVLGVTMAIAITTLPSMIFNFFAYFD